MDPQDQTDQAVVAAVAPVKADGPSEPGMAGAPIPQSPAAAEPARIVPEGEKSPAQAGPITAPISTPAPVVLPATGGDAPLTIAVPKAPGKDGAMEVVMAAEILRRVNRTRQTVSLVSQVIIRAYEEEALHEEICRHLVTFGGFLMAWIGVAEEGPAADGPERTVRVVAHAGLEANFLNALKITWSDDLGNRSPTSRAIQEQRPHVARNILKEPRYAVLRHEAQLYGYTATCAVPLQFAQYGMGVLTIHAMEPDAFNAEEVSLLRELANDLVAGVIGLRERAKRQVLEERLIAVIDAADDAVIGTDNDGIVTDWNGGATRLFGYERSEVVGRPITDSIVPAASLDEALRMRAAIARGERVERFETVRQSKQGLRIQTSIMITPIYAGDGKIVGATAVEHDVTGARAAESSRQAVQLEEAEVLRLKALETVRSVFISEAAHELNTPLTPLRIHVEALAEREDVNAEQRSHLVVIERNVLRLCSLVKDMLEASRLETGRFALVVKPVPLNVVLGDAVDGVIEAAAKAEVNVEVMALEKLVVTADANRVSQVLHNLFGNAIAFTPKGGRIGVSLRLENGQAVVRIQDSGVGLSSDQIAKLFQPFSRPHEKDRSSPKGTGLGLFISKGIIEQHGGHIWAESKGLGTGSTFCFSLPLEKAQLQVPPAPPVPPVPESDASEPEVQPTIPPADAQVGPLAIDAPLAASRTIP